MIYLMILLMYKHWSCEPGTGTQKVRLPSVLPVPSAPGSHVEAKALVILDVGVLSQIVMFPSRNIKMWRATVQSSRWKQETELCTRDLVEGNTKSNISRFPKLWINQHIRHINLVNSVRLYLYMIINKYIYIFNHFFMYMIFLFFFCWVNRLGFCSRYIYIKCGPESGIGGLTCDEPLKVAHPSFNAI